MPSDKISVVIPCYIVDESFLDMTKKCFESLYETARPFESILVDDGSPYKGWHSHSPSAHTTVLDENKGYAAAVNVGLAETRGDIIIICNNDIEFIQADWLDHLLKPLKEGYDISSIRTTDSDGWEVEDKITQGDKFGSLWAMKRKVYEKLGGLNELYGKGYFEDLDYQRRAEQQGFKVGKNHRGLVHHIGKATFKIVDPEDKSFWEAREKFVETWGESKL